MKNKKCPEVLNTVRRVAAEDIRKGDYVTVLSEVYELPSFLWGCSNESLPAGEPVRLQLLSQKSGTPHKVKEVCLPFVYATPPGGKLITLDVRRHSLARLEKKRAKSVWNSLTHKQ